MAPKTRIQSLKSVVWWLEKISKIWEANRQNCQFRTPIAPLAIEISLQNIASKTSAFFFDKLPLLLLQETFMAKSKRGEMCAKSIIGGTFGAPK